MKAKEDRIIEVNFHLMNYKRELLLSEEGIKYRKRRAIEPEAVFGQMKFDMGYKRFRHRGFDKVQMDFGLFAMAFNLKKLCAKLAKAHWRRIIYNKTPYFNIKNTSIDFRQERNNKLKRAA